MRGWTSFSPATQGHTASTQLVRYIFQKSTNGFTTLLHSFSCFGHSMVLWTKMAYAHIALGLQAR